MRPRDLRPVDASDLFDQAAEHQHGLRRSHGTGGGVVAGAESTGAVIAVVVLHPPGRAATSSGVWVADSLDHSHFFESQATALIEWCG